MTAVEQIDRRIRAVLGGWRQAFRGVLTLVKAAGAVQLVQMDALAGEQLQDNELFQHYGFTSNPLPGTMAIVLPIGGRTAHGIIVATEHGSYRLKSLESGEVALYTDEGDHVILKRGRLIEVTTETFRVNAGAAIEFNAPTITGNASDAVIFNTPTVNASANIIAAGDVFDHTTKSMLGMRTAYNGHTHPGDSGGTTGAPSAGM